MRRAHPGSPALPVYALVLLAKESALVAPLLVAAARLWVPAVVDRRRAIRDASALAAVAALYALIRFGPMAGPPEYAERAGGTLWPTLVGMGNVLLRYMRLLVLPFRAHGEPATASAFSSKTKAISRAPRASWKQRSRSTLRRLVLSRAVELSPYDPGLAARLQALERR